MLQTIRSFEQVGQKYRGGIQQKYILDDRGRRLILDMYDSQSETIDRLERMIGVPRRVIKKWAREMGLARQKEPPWTQEEVAYLTTWINKKKVRLIAKHLGRTTTAVRIKARRLHLSFVNADGYSMADIKLAMGNDEKTILKWIDKGWLKGKRQGPNSNVWRFTDKNLRDFVIAHPNEIDHRRIDWIWMVDLLAGGIGSLADERGSFKEAKLDDAS